jgi:hypothetical protein
MTSDVLALRALCPASCRPFGVRTLLTQLHATGKRFWRRWRLTWTAHLHFVPGWLVVTDRRLLSRERYRRPMAGNGLTRMALDLLHHDHAGVGHLDLVNTQRLACHLAVYAGAEPAGDSLGGSVSRAAGKSRQRQTAGAGFAQRVPQLQGAAGAGPGRMPGLYQGGAHTRHRPGRCCACGVLPSPTAASCCWVLFSCCWALRPARCRPT